jgi:hypothetical protein
VVGCAPPLFLIYWRNMRRHTLATSKEEKVAVSIGKLLSDFTLDLEAVGKYLATANAHILYVRALTVLEATEYNNTVAEYREIGKYYANELRNSM